MISPWLEKFEKVSHLMVRCSGRCHMLGSRCFPNGRFAANASRRLLTLAFKSLDVTNDPANIRRQRSRRDREEEIPGLCNPRARGPGYRHGVSYQRSVGQYIRVQQLCEAIGTRHIEGNEEMFVETLDRHVARTLILKREIQFVRKVSRDLCKQKIHERNRTNGQIWEIREGGYDKSKKPVTKHVYSNAGLCIEFVVPKLDTPLTR